MLLLMYDNEMGTNNDKLGLLCTARQALLTATA